MYLNIRNGTSKLIIFRFSIIKKSERILLDNPIIYILPFNPKG